MIILLAQRCPSKSATIVHLFYKPGACSSVFCSLLTIVAVLLASVFCRVPTASFSAFSFALLLKTDFWLLWARWASHKGAAENTEERMRCS